LTRRVWRGDNSRAVDDSKETPTPEPMPGLSLIAFLFVEARRGEAGHGEAGFGRHGEAGQGVAGEAGPGMARPGAARHGVARPG
jgi:hypothetical protein